MSISSSLSNALSGMTAAARTAQAISANVANATTEGYARRVLETSSRVIGGQASGVQVDGIRRDTDLRILSDRRLSDAELGYADTRAAFFEQFESAIGLPGDGASLSDGITALESALVAASSRPDSDVRLEAVVTAAQTLSTKFNQISDGIQQQRERADQDIATQVELLNDRLSKVAALNEQIIRQQTSGSSAAALMDQRQLLVDEIADIVPLRQLERDGGQIALYTVKGAPLLDGRAAEIGFSPVGTIVPEMTIASGALSALEINGQPVDVSGPYSPIAGGSLAALFEVRDADTTAAQAELDALARDLVARFQSSGTDPTLISGDAGLFTDAGAAFDTLNEVGLSARLAVNTRVIPEEGGEVWRVRDGLNATSAGAVGDTAQIERLLSAMETALPTASGRNAGQSHDADSLATAFLSYASGLRQSTQADQSYASAKNVALVTTELERGVDTDQEMQNLLLVEQAYAANARVIQTVDDMLNTILGLAS